MNLKMFFKMVIKQLKKIIRKLKPALVQALDAQTRKLGTTLFLKLFLSPQSFKVMQAHAVIHTITMLTCTCFAGGMFIVILILDQ